MARDDADLRDGIAELLPRLRRFARSLTNDPVDADDLTQLCMERALSRLDQWRRGSKLDSWMFGIMKNAWIDEVRYRKRRAHVFLAPEAGERTGAEDENIELRVRAMEVERAMADLPDEQRLAVSLVLVEGLSYRDAAEVMGVPIGTLTSRLARGREALEAKLAGDEGGGT
ncbi:MAG: RNA polymerase sigma factor [Maricaulaceae bacterium]|nr:RNA polymerase sigma factor [Maricaulaceae bacterium]